MSTESISENVLQALKTVKYPGFSRDIVSFGLVKSARQEGGVLEVLLALTTAEPKVAEEIRDHSLRALQGLPGVVEVKVKVDIQAPARAVAPGGAAAAVTPAAIEGVRHVIAVASGKGGVGKSTVAANLAAALVGQGFRTGLCDCDIYGPSVAHMFGSQERPYADEQDRIVPINRYGLELMSMGFLLDDNAPAVLRGPMVSRYTQQFLRQVAWGGLDFLILDLPPGTGDIQLTVVQTVALAGAVVVTTPQEMALIDARKATTMFHKTSVEVLGIVENMSFFLCPGDGVAYDIFGSGGGEREAKRLGVPLLGQIPLEPALRESGDKGKPLVFSHPESASAQAFTTIARSIVQHLQITPASTPA
jgi:ATP-binding protein involved in chromosome partitioning